MLIDILIGYVLRSRQLPHLMQLTHDTAMEVAFFIVATLKRLSWVLAFIMVLTCEQEGRASIPRYFVLIPMVSESESESRNPQKL